MQTLQTGVKSRCNIAAQFDILLGVSGHNDTGIYNK